MVVNILLAEQSVMEFPVERLCARFLAGSVHFRIVHCWHALGSLIRKVHIVDLPGRLGAVDKPLIGRTLGLVDVTLVSFGTPGFDHL
jgi:hypothetical protein